MRGRGAGEHIGGAERDPRGTGAGASFDGGSAPVAGFDGMLVSMLRLRLGLAVLLFVGCDAGTGQRPPSPQGTPLPDTITLGGGEASVVIATAPFKLTVKNSRGEVVLDGLPASGTASADDPSQPYGSLGVTHRETDFTLTIVEGFDHVKQTDDPWRFVQTITAAHFDQNSATFDFVYGDDVAHTMRVDIAVEGATVKIDARAAAPATDRTPNVMGMAFALPADEHFFGLGERNVTEDHRGRNYGCWVEEGGIALGEKAPPGPYNPSPNGPTMTHVPVPFYLSTKGYGLYLQTTYRAGFDFGATLNDAFRLWSEEPHLSLRLFVRDDPKQALSDYTAITGRPHLPAPWVFGPRRRVGNGDKVGGLPEEEVMRQKGVPVTALDDATHFLPSGSQVGREVELSTWTAKLHDLGYKAIGYYNAYVSVTDKRAQALVDYGKAHDLFVRKAPEDGQAVGDFFQTFMVSGGGQQVLTIDFTNPEAVTWYQSLLQQALDIGYDGWMLDFGEYLPQTAKMHDGRLGWEMHNAFPLIYQRATTEYMRRVRGDDWMYFARSGWAGTQQYAPIVWSGDPAASFDDAKGLPAQVRNGINAGLSGIAFWGSDIGGYACNADPPGNKEVLLRWVEFGAFSSDMHDENSCAQQPAGSPPKATLWDDAQSTEVWSRYARLHTRMFPYIYAAADEATRTGMPVIRHPFLMHPEDPNAKSAELEYWFGPSLYVAPVVRRSATSRDATLPPGTWFDWWTMAPVDGGKKVTRDAPLDVLPLWIRSGGIVAMLDPKIDTLAPESRPDITSLGDVDDILDVRAAIDPTAQHGDAVLQDGTTLFLALQSPGAPTLPAGFTTAASDDELLTCAKCGKIDPLPNGAFRLRLTEAAAIDHTFAAGPVLLHAWRFTKPTRVRWDVAVKPG